VKRLQSAIQAEPCSSDHYPSLPPSLPIQRPVLPPSLPPSLPPYLLGIVLNDGLGVLVKRLQPILEGGGLVVRTVDEGLARLLRGGREGGRGEGEGGREGGREGG